MWEVLRALWPPPARITQVGRLARAEAGSWELAVLPNGRQPVVLVPRRPLPAAASALRHYKASADARGQARLRAAAVAARLGLAAVAGDRVRVSGAAPDPAAAGAAGTASQAADIASYLRSVLGRDAVFSLYIGPPRANRKPVMQALTPGGELLGFVKVGVTPLTAELVRAEAAALSFLNGLPLARLRAPRLLYHGSWQGHEVLVQEAFPGGRPAPGHVAVALAMAELAGVHGISRWAATASPYWLALRSRLDALPQREFAVQLARTLERLVPTAVHADLAFGSWHGDWTPWNMTMAGGCALVWDWERFGSGVPVGYDAVHYWLQGAIVRGGVPPLAAARQALAEAADLVGPMGVDPAHARLVAALYLVEIGTRYLHDGQAEAGAKLGRLDTWLLPALDNVH
jgi:Phosphotransferase enzyme family